MKTTLLIVACLFTACAQKAVNAPNYDVFDYQVCGETMAEYDRLFSQMAGEIQELNRENFLLKNKLREVHNVHSKRN